MATFRSALARNHQTACYGALAPIVARGELERGFLRRVRLKKADLPLLQKLATAPDWATVEELGVADVWREHQVSIAAPQLPRLRALVMREDAGCEFERYGWTLTLRRDALGRFSAASASHDGRRRVNRLSAPCERLAEDLMQLPADALSSLRFDACRGVPAEGRAALEAALARQNRLADVKLPR